MWGFPYKAYDNGGGAFLIPYMIVMLLIGRPMYFLELVLGQFSSKSSIKIWDVVPGFRGMVESELIFDFIRTHFPSI